MDKLRAYVEKYSDAMTVSMLVDLCDATGIYPAELISGGKAIKANEVKVVEKKVNKINEREIQVIKVQENVEKKFYTCKQVAEMLNINKELVWKHIRDGKLTVVKLGREYRVRDNDLNDYINANLIQKA